MLSDDILILRERDVSAVLDGRETDLVELVRRAYEAHARGFSSLTHSTFLRFPDSPRDRIIALPAYLGSEFEVAGIKWIASFPGNHGLGVDRASAVIILNSMQTGRPVALLEGSVISAKRTAASAALAARHLHRGVPESIGVVGCGPIGFEIVRFLRAVYPGATNFVVFDLDRARAEQFGERCAREFEGVKVEVAESLKELMRATPLVCFATTALKPHVEDLGDCRPGSTILHVSLRDIAPEALLSCDNVADDIDHVCRAETSVHLAEQLTGGRDFIRCNLADILLGEAPPRADEEGVVVFSPFGLGILDMALAQLVYASGLEQGLGTVIDSFLPAARAEEARAARA